MNVELTTVEIMALKKLAIISGALAASLQSPSARREQMALTKVLTDVIGRALTATPPREEE